MTDLSADRTTDYSGSTITDAFVLDSDLAAMAQLEEWVDQLVVRHGMTDRARFATKLCIEEAVSNSIRHGYKGIAGSEVRVSVSGSAEVGWVITIEDDAPPFNPLAQPELPAISPEYIGLGGQGIRLMKAYSSSFSYQQTATGNRLQMVLAGSASPSGAPSIA